MGYLAVGRREYDFDDPKFVEVKEKILWRIHDLGYSLDKFTESLMTKVFCATGHIGNRRRIPMKATLTPAFHARHTKSKCSR